MPKVTAKRDTATRRTNPSRGVAAMRSKTATTKVVKFEPDVEEVKPTVSKGKGKAKTTTVAKEASIAKKAAPPKLKKPKSESPAPDPISAAISILDDDGLTPADLILAITKGTPHRGVDNKSFQDDLYYPYGTSKLDTILDELAEAKHGRKVLKEWIANSETGMAIVEKVIDQEMRGGVGSEDEDDEDDCRHCCC